MTTGIVSAVGRQPHPDFPMQIERQGQYVYIEREFEERPQASGTDRVGKREAEPGPERRYVVKEEALTRRCSAGDVARA